MAEDTILLPDQTPLATVQDTVAGLDLPASVEVRVEPARDYPGQELAVDVSAPTPALLDAAVEGLTTVLAGWRPRLASTVDEATLAAGAAGAVDPWAR